MVKPPKNRSSITRACCGSSSDKSSNASSSATRSRSHSLRHTGGLIERKRRQGAASLFRMTMTGVIHQNAPHHPRGDGEKVHPVAPLHAFLVNQAKVRFINQRRALQGMLASLHRQMTPRNIAQLIVNEGHQPVEGALSPRFQPISSSVIPGNRVPVYKKL